MNIYGWKDIQKEMSLKEIFSASYIQFAAQSIDLNFDIETLYKKPKSFQDMQISIKKLDSRVDNDKDQHRELYVEKGNIIAIWLLYHIYNHSGVTYSFVEKLSMGEDGFVETKELSTDHKEEYNTWANRLERKVEALIHSGLIGNVKQLCQEYADMTFRVNISEIKYTGKTIDIPYSEEMTIAEFADIVRKKCHVIPVFAKPYSFDLYPTSMRLKSLGVSGEKVYSFPSQLGMGNFNGFAEENNMDVLLHFKYEDKTWMYIHPETQFELVREVPEFFQGIYNNISLRVLCWLVRFLTKHGLVEK